MSDFSKAENLPDIEIANIVASGKIDIELDLAEVALDLREETEWITEVEHSRRQGNRLLINFVSNEVLGILAPTGVFVLTGGDTYTEVEEAKNDLFHALASLGIIPSDFDAIEFVDEFAIQNVVCTAELESDQINLNALAIGLGLESTEYEPEQFPGLIYRPSSGSCTILIFATGKVVVTGVRDEQVAQEEFTDLKETILTVLQ